MQELTVCESGPYIVVAKYVKSLPVSKIMVDPKTKPLPSKDMDKRFAAYAHNILKKVKLNYTI